MQNDSTTIAFRPGKGHPRAHRFAVNGEPRYVLCSPIPGSPVWLCREFYACDDAPSGYYLTGEPAYIGGTDIEAAMEFARLRFS